MASLTGRLISDQNLNLNFNGGGSVRGDMKAAQAQKKGMSRGRKPLGDLSNAGIMKPSLNQAPKKQSSRNFTLLDEETESSKIKSNANKKITSSKASDRKQAITSCRKALSDISNTEKLNFAPEASKNKTTKLLSVVAEGGMEDIGDIADEGFIHNHHECIKQQARASAVDMDRFLETLGLYQNKDHSHHPLSSPCTSPLEPESPPIHLKGEEEEEYDTSSGLDTPIRFWSPGSAELPTKWKETDANFTMAASPNR